MTHKIKRNAVIALLLLAVVAAIAYATFGSQTETPKTSAQLYEPKGKDLPPPKPFHVVPRD